MSRPARPWFRFYVEAFGDRKLLRLDPVERWLWVAVLGAARESCEPGRLLVAPGEPMTVDELARYADVPHDQVWTALRKMERYGMVGWDEDGLIVVQNWDHRQYESDTSASRTAKYRTKDCDVTTPSQPPSQDRHSDAGCDDIVTDQIQIQKTETDAEREGGLSQTKADPPSKRRKAATPIPSPYIISESNLAWVKAKYPTLNFDLETQKLVAWAKAGDHRKANWDQAWRGWMHRAAERKPW